MALFQPYVAVVRIDFIAPAPVTGLRFGTGFCHWPKIAGIGVLNDPIGTRQMGSTQVECSG